MTYVTSDLHGYPLAKFKALLEKAGFSDEDVCFVLGDVIDRGPESVALLRWIMAQPNMKLILGNHEAMLLSCASLLITVDSDSLNDETIAALNTWIANGGRGTLQALAACGSDTVADVVAYLRSAPLYRTVRADGREFLLVHSGLGAFAPEKTMDGYAVEELLWTRPRLTQKYFDDVLTVLGHTPTYFYGPEHRGKVLFTDTWIDLDTGAAYGEAPALLRLEDLAVFYA